MREKEGFRIYRLESLWDSSRGDNSSGWLFKILRYDGHSPIVMERWELPNGGKPGPWMPPVEGPLKEGANGYHLFTVKGLLLWALWRRPSIYPCYLAEGRGDQISHASEGVLVYRQARLLRRLDTWDDEAQRQFAADCLEHVLQAYALRYPGHCRIIAFATYCLKMLREQARGMEPLLGRREAWRAWTSGTWKGRPLSRLLVVTAISFLDSFQTDSGFAMPYRYARVLAASLVCPGLTHTGDRAERWEAARNEEFEWQSRRLARYLGVQEPGPGGKPKSERSVGDIVP